MALRPSLVIAAAAFSAAIIVLAVDSAWGVGVTLEWQDEDGRWRAVSSEDQLHARPEPGGGALRVPANGSLDFRVIVDNERPVGLDDRVTVTWQSFGPNGTRTATPVDEPADAGAFSTQSFTFTLAQAQLAAASGSADASPDFAEHGGSFHVRVGDRGFSYWAQVQVVAAS